MLLLCEGQVNLYHFYENVIAVNLFLLLSCGLLVVVQNNPVSAIFSFVLTAFFSYLFLVLIGAEFFALLVLIIYVWTPPHFWALAIARQQEYAKAKIPMLPVTHGIDFTKTCILLYTWLLIAVSYMPFLTHLSGWLYMGVVSVLNGIFLYYAIQLKWFERPGTAMRTFGYSIVYLFALFIALLIDHAGWIN